MVDYYDYDDDDCENSIKPIKNKTTRRIKQVTFCRKHLGRKEETEDEKIFHSQ